MTDTSKKALPKKKKAIAEGLLNHSQGGLQELCELEGLDMAELCRLFADDEFTAYLHRLVEGYCRGSLASVWEALIARCREGDMKAIKLYFDLKGESAGEQSAPTVIITGADELE